MADEPTTPVEGEEEVASTQPEEAVATAEADAAETAETESATEEPSSDGPTAEDIKVPEFASLTEGPGRKTNGSMDRFLDVHVPVWAELGRVELPLGDLVELSEGAVLRLDRPISDPVDVVSQGVKLARGEVIVVDDCFAIRIKEIVAKK